MQTKVCVITSAHDANDIRIFVKELNSLIERQNYEMYFAAPGSLKINNCTFISLGSKPTSRFRRFTKVMWVPYVALIKSNAKIWHLHDPELIPFGLILRLLRKKVIWDAHEDYFAQFNNTNPHRSYIHPRFQKIINTSMKILLRLIDRISNGVIAATEEVAKKYKNRNIQIVGNECILENFLEHNPHFESSKILFIGAMNYQQSFEKVVDAVSRIPFAKLVAAGHKSLNEFNYASNKLGDSFEYVGLVDQKKIASLISESSIGLMTYYNSKIYDVPNSPNKFFEFAAGGLPILGTPTLANIQLIKESNCGHIIEGFEIEDIQKGILLMLNSIDNLKLWSLNGKNWAVSRGNWNQSKRNLFAMYDSI